MPVTGIKIVGTGACLPWCSISFSLQNSLKMSGHRGFEILEFCSWNLVPFLPDIGFQLLKCLWLSIMYLSFNDAPNVLYMGNIWTAGRPIQHRTLLLRSHAVIIATVCWILLKYMWSVWREAYVALKPNITFSIHSAFQNFQAADTVCAYETPFELNGYDMLKVLPPL